MKIDIFEDYQIQKITSEHNPFVAKLIRDNLEKHGLDIPGTAYFDTALDSLYEFYSNSSKRDYYVLTDKDGNIVGGVGFAEFTPFKDCAELQKLYLADCVKGQGLGYKLISFIENKMIEAGYKASYLETHDNLKTAIYIYEKIGYSRIEQPDVIGHIAMNNFFYKKLITEGR